MATLHHRPLAPVRSLNQFTLLIGFFCAGLCWSAWTRAVTLGNTESTSGSQAAMEDARWHDSFEAFAAADKLRAPVPGGVVFVGSSSIRLWDGLETAFQDPATIVKRGFGGSRLLDCARNVDRLVLPYKPRLVVVYAGDNDLAEGRSPEQVLQSFKTFTARVHSELPATRIAFISIKPSPERAHLLPQIREANTLVRDYVTTASGLDYIDIFSAMVDAAGHPRDELFLPDHLHLNSSGYAVWRQAIAPYLH
jgi:lysophospholipase L1-like esterase